MDPPPFVRRSVDRHIVDPNNVNLTSENIDPSCSYFGVPNVPSVQRSLLEDKQQPATGHTHQQLHHSIGTPTKWQNANRTDAFTHKDSRHQEIPTHMPIYGSGSKINPEQSSHNGILLPDNVGILSQSQSINHMMQSQPTHFMSNNHISALSNKSPDLTHNSSTVQQQYRQLPSMSTVMANNSRVDHLLDVNNLRPVVGNEPQPAVYRRTLPQMGQSCGDSGFTQYDNDSYQRYSLGEPSGVHYHKQRTPYGSSSVSSTATKRQLPIVTPYGPQPLHPRQLPQMQNIANHHSNQIAPVEMLQTLTKQYIESNSKSYANKPPSIRTRFNDENTSTVKPCVQQQNRDLHYKRNRSHRPVTRQYQQLQQSQSDREQINEKSHRKLPIITKQGVLKLRGSSNQSSEMNIPARQTIIHESRNVNQKGRQHQTSSRTRSSKQVTLDKDNSLDEDCYDDLVDSHHRPKRLSIMSVNDSEQHEDSGDQQCDIDLEDEQTKSDEMIYGDSDEHDSSEVNSVSLKSDQIDGDMTPDHELESNEYLGVTVDEHKVFDEQAESISEASATFVHNESDMILDNDSYYNDTHQDDEQIDEEGEYFSALATVPEEEGKLTDREDIQNYEQDARINDSEEFGGPNVTHEINQSEQFQSSNSMMMGENEKFSQVTGTNNNGTAICNNKKLPTIVENGFEVQVLEYIAGKTGLRHSELFSVDEEPSSYNDDAQSRSSERSDRVIEQNNGSDQDGSQVVELTKMINSSAYHVNEGGDNTGHDDDNMCHQEQLHQNDINDASGQFYELQNNNFDDQKNMTNYELDQDLEDEQILMSPTNANKTSFEQDEYDEQYRDINNLEDLERRATNHVHAIDGHSKSMLNDIHQQRTIVDYFDDGDFVTDPTNIKNVNNVDGNLNSNYITEGSALQQIDERSQFQAPQNITGHVGDFEQAGIQVNEQNVGAKEIFMEGNDQQLAVEQKYNHQENYQQQPEHEHDQIYDQDQHHQQEQANKEDDVMQNGFDTSMPRARIRWKTAFDKIINRAGEVSNHFISLPSPTLPPVCCKCTSRDL